MSSVLIEPLRQSAESTAQVAQVPLQRLDVVKEALDVLEGREVEARENPTHVPVHRAPRLQGRAQGPLKPGEDPVFGQQPGGHLEQPIIGLGGHGPGASSAVRPSGATLPRFWGSHRGQQWTLGARRATGGGGFVAEAGHIWDRELVLVTGKGGVGKTSVTAALAKAAHRAGRRVLVGEVTPDTSTISTLLGLFGQPRPASEDPVELASNLYGVRITPTIGHKLFLKAALKIGLVVDTAMRSAALTRFLLAAPAFPEIGTFYQLVSLLRQKRYDHLILDLPATGHAIGLISLPKTVLRVLPAGLIGDAIKEGLEVLTNPKRTAAVLVTLPESLPVTESLELCDAMRHHQVAVRSMILNRMPAEPFSPLELQALDHHLAHRPGDRLLLGTKELRRLERALEARDLFRERVPPDVERVEVPALEIKAQAAVVDHLANVLAAVRIGGAP